MAIGQRTEGPTDDAATPPPPSRATKPRRALAKRYGVDRRTISFIHRGATWTHVDAPLVDRGSMLERLRSSAQLTIEQVREVKRRLAAGEKPPRIARDFAVGHGAIYSIKYGRTWKDIAA